MTRPRSDLTSGRRWFVAGLLATAVAIPGFRGQAVAAPAATGPKFTVTQIPLPAQEVGGLRALSTTAMALDDRGEVVGYACYPASTTNGEPGCSYQIFVYQNGKMTIAHAPSNEGSCTAEAVNDTGVIAATCWVGVGYQQAHLMPYRLTPSKGGWRWQELLDPDGNPETGFSSGIDSGGEVVGALQPFDDAAAVWHAARQRATSLAAGPGFTVTAASAVDSDGDVGGWEGTRTRRGPVLAWLHGKRRVILKFAHGHAEDVNALMLDPSSSSLIYAVGRVEDSRYHPVGGSGNPADRAAVWMIHRKHGKRKPYASFLREIPPFSYPNGAHGEPQSNDSSEAFAVNARGEIVGGSWGGGWGSAGELQRAFLYEDGKDYNLNKLMGLPPQNAPETAVGINSSGQIVTAGVGASGDQPAQSASYLLTPSSG